MKVGDVVIITESFGSGAPYEGSVGILRRFGEWYEDQVLYTSQVDIDHPKHYLSFICNCIPATDLLKALV